MRRLIALLLATALTMGSVFGVAAQDAPTSISSGFGSPATWTDDRGNQVATLEVNEVVTEWDGHSEYSAPERAHMFQAVTFTVTNISGSGLIIEPYDFSLVDDLGRNNARSWVSVDEANEGLIFEDDLPLSADESAELTLVYQTPVDVSASALVWQPDSGVLVIAHFGETPAENAAVVFGYNTPSTWIDERGNPVATLEVVDVDEDWQDYSEYREPERGTVYRAVHIKVTNISGSSLIIEPYDFSLLDSTGLNNSRSWVDAAEGSDVLVFSDDTPLSDGETFEGVIVFQMYADIAPTAMMWQPDRGLLNMVVLEEGAESTPAASPEAGDDVEATPAVEEDDADDSQQDALVASLAERNESEAAAGEVTDVNGEAAPFVDVTDAELGDVSVVSTLDGWDGYDEAANAPVDGTRFFLVTMDVTVTSEDDVPMSPLDFVVVTETGGEYEGELLLNAADADVEVTQSGGSLTAGETTTLVIPFVVPDGEVPTSVIWETGQDTVELSLVP